MLLENLKQFDWMNEPHRVRFDEKGMYVTAKPNTDFWCCSKYDFCKDDGHFFFSYALEDFCCELDWEFYKADIFDQCGIMLRIDVNNWLKASIMCEKDGKPQIVTSMTNEGLSDLVVHPLSSPVSHVWYRLKKRRGCYTVSYSLDGTNYKMLRKFYMVNDLDDVRVGAYICSPQHENFEAVLKEIKFT
jgi:regulation of enolase protein 1 (concanavalin A-like superfamily)